MTVTSVLLAVILYTSLAFAQGFSGSVQLKVDGSAVKWKQGFGNENSEDYKGLSKKVRPKLSVLFQDFPDVKSIKITGFRQESVFCDFNITLSNGSNLTTKNLTIVLERANNSLEISSGTPKTFKVTLEITNTPWKDSHGDKTTYEYKNLENRIKEVLEIIYRNTPGLVDIEIIGFKKSDDGKVTVEFKILLDSSSHSKLKDVKQTLEDSKGSSATGGLQFGTFSIEEQTVLVTSKKVWVLVLAIVGCVLVSLIVIGFICHIMRQSCMPKIMWNQSGADDPLGEEQRHAKTTPQRSTTDINEEPA